MAILVFIIDIYAVTDATSVLHGAFNNTLCCDRFSLSRGSWEIWRKTRQSTPPKPEPDAALLKNKVNHNMCIGLLNKEIPHSCIKQVEAETFSCSTVYTLAH